jgi:hypothetical protein
MASLAEKMLVLGILSRSCSAPLRSTRINRIVFAAEKNIILVAFLYPDGYKRPDGNAF